MNTLEDDEEITRLVATFHETERRLEELTGGEVDTFTDHRGRTLVLRRGHDRMHLAEAALQASILDALPAHVALLNSTGCIVSVNETWREFARANAMKDEAFGVGSSYLQICERASGPDSLEAGPVAAGIRAVLAGHETSYSIEYPCHGPAEQRWFALTVTPLAEGGSKGAVVMHLNITERKRVARECDRTLDRLNEAQHVGGIGDWDFDLDTGEITWSREVFRILGRSIDAGPPRSYEEHAALYTPASRVVLAEHIDRAISSATRQEYELTQERPDGRIVHVCAVAVPETDETGRVRRIHGTVQDITAQKNALTTLQEREAELRNTQRLAGLGSWSLDFGDETIRWSQETFRIFGLDPRFSAPSYQGLAKFLTPASFAAMDEALLKTREQGARYELELELIRPDHTHRWILAQGEPDREATGRIQGARGTVLDITERKLSQLALSELSERTEGRERLLSTMLASIEDFAYIFDREGRFLFANQPLLDLLRLSLSSVVGRNFFELGYPEELAARLQLQVQEVFDTAGRVVDQTPFLDPDGLAGYYEYIFSPVIAPDGSVEFVVGATRDVSERRRAEDVLRESEAKFSGAFEHAPLAMALVSIDHRWLRVNQAMCGLLGYTAAELLGHSVIDVSHPDDVLPSLEYVRLAIAGDARPFQIAKRYIHKQGNLIKGLLSIALVRDAEGEPLYFVAQIQDVTERLATESELRDSLQKFQQLAGNILDVFWIRSHDLKQLHYVSPAFEKVWGRSTASLYAHPHEWSDFILPDDRERVRAAFALLTGDVPVNLDIEYRIARPDGEVRWVRARGTQVRDDQGTHIRNIGIITDITEKQRASEALRESEQEQRHQAEQLKVERSRLVAAQRVAKVGSWEIDIDTMAVRRSEETHRIFETDPSVEADLRDDFVLRVHPDDRGRLNAAFAASLKRNEPFSIEHRLLLPEGRIKFVEEIWQVSFDADGRPSCATGTCQDITKRTQDGEALRQSQQRLRDAFDGLGPSMFVALLSPEGIVLEINRSPLEAAGLRAGDVLGKSFPETHWWSYSPDVQRELREAIVRAAAGESSRYDVQVRCAGDQIIDLDFSLSALRDDSGKVVFLVPSASVITDRKVAESALRQAHKMEAVGQLAAGVAHEFNNLLQALMSMTAIVRLRSGASEVTEAGSQMETLIRRGAGLTQQLLLFSRQGPIEKSHLDLGEQVKNAAFLLRLLVPESIRIVMDLSPDRLPIDGDAGQIQQVLLNLAINARDALHSSGVLTLRTGRVGDEVFQEVEDSGEGMSAETQAHLFEPFFTTKESGKGTGLGLAVVHGIVEQHGGRIEVWSQPGVGSRFRVIFPLSSRSDEGAAVAAHGSVPSISGRILLVEDNPDVREGIATLLEMIGYEVTAVESGEAAIALVLDQAPDLVLSDVSLPGIPGPELVRILRQRWPLVAVVLMSGYFDEIMRTNAAQEKWHFLQKPFELSDLAHELRVAQDIHLRAVG